MEFFDLQGRSHGGAPALGFGTADAFGSADHFDVPGSKQSQDALVEAKVANRILNFPVLDIPHAIAREPSEEGCPRIDAADIPETADEQTAFRGLDHLLDAERLCRCFPEWC